MEALSFSSYFNSYKTYSVGTRDVADADAVFRKSFESSNVSNSLLQKLLQHNKENGSTQVLFAYTIIFPTCCRHT